MTSLESGQIVSKSTRGPAAFGPSVQPRRVAGSPPLPPPESLKELATRLRASLRQGAVAEGLVGVEVVRLAANWKKNAPDADGLEIGPWLRKYVDARRSLSWYERKASAHEAAKLLGVSECMDSVAACWWADHVPEGQREETAETIRDAWRDGGRVALNRHQLARLCASFVSRRKPWASAQLARALEHIERLKAQIMKLGGEPVE